MAVEYAGCVWRFALLSSEGGKEGGGVRGRVGRRVREGREGGGQKRERERHKICYASLGLKTSVL